MKQNPCQNQSDRRVQIRQLFRANFSTEQIVEMGFPHLEVTKVRTSMDEDKVLKNRNETVQKLKDPIKCRKCGWQSERHLSSNGVCKVCLEQESNREARRKGYRV